MFLEPLIIPVLVRHLSDTKLVACFLVTILNSCIALIVNNLRLGENLNRLFHRFYLRCRMRKIRIITLFL